MRLGNKSGYTDVDFTAGGVTALARWTDPEQRLDQIDQCGQILVGFGRQADHKLQLDDPRSQSEGVFVGIEDFAAGYVLIDYVT